MQLEAGWESFNKVVLDINPDDTRPRNSEGAFLSLKDGSVLFVYSHFYGGKRDASAANLESVRSHDGGRTWNWPPRVEVENEGECNVMSVSLLRLRRGADDSRVALFYCVKNGMHDCRPYVRFSDDEAATWSEARPLLEERSYFVLNNDRVIQLSSGRLVASLAELPYEPEKRIPCKARWYLSDDLGQNWFESATVATLPGSSLSGLQEPGVIELLDGSLLSWMRTDQGCQYICRSTDGGETWTPPEPWNLVSPTAPASVKRVPQSSELLAIYNDHSGQYPIPGRSQPANPENLDRRRNPLVAAFSADEGLSWPVKSVIEDDPRGFFCYTAIEFVEDAVLLAYCAGDYEAVGGKWGRLRIRRVNLEWLRESHSARRETSQ